MRFIAFVEMWKRDCRLTTSASWKSTQDQVIQCHILPYLSSKSVERISPADISEVIDSSKAKGHKPNTTKKIYMVLSKMFADAVEFFELRDKSPVKKRYHLPFVPPVKRPYETFERSVVILEYVFSHALYGLPIWIMLLAGLRISEVESLSWDDIDWDLEVINVRSSYCMTAKKVRPYTKNKNQYTVPLAPMLYTYLWNRRGEGLICRRESGGMMSRWGLKNYLRELQKKLKLKVRSSHGLRHSCARICVEKGASDEQIMELLGHKWLASSKTYTHRDGTNFLKKIMKKIA